MSVMLYPLGLSFDQAFEQRSFIYGNFLDKSDAMPTIEALAAMQDSHIRKLSASATVEYIPTITRENEKALLRRANVSEAYKGLEYTLLIDLDKGVLFFVLLTSTDHETDNLRILEWVAQECVPLRITYSSDPSADNQTIQPTSKAGG